MDRSFRYSSKGPELLIDMVERASHILMTQGGIDPKSAETLAIAFVNEIAKNWGGSYFYLPKGNWNGGELSCFELTDRDRKIFRAYRGKNRDEICTRFGISPQRLYQIVCSCRLEIARRLTAADRKSAQV